MSTVAMKYEITVLWHYLEEGFCYLHDMHANNDKRRKSKLVLSHYNIAFSV